MPPLALAHGSLALVFVVLVGAGFGLPVPEELVVLTAGVLAHRGVVPGAAALATCLVGILGGDVLLFLLARRLGAALLERRWFRRLLPAARRARVEALFVRHGGKVVLVARHVPGLRAPVFALAGAHEMRLGRFVSWDLLGLSISAPAVFAIGQLSSANVDRVRAGVAHAEHWLVLAAVAAALLGAAVVALLRRRRS